MSENIIPIVSNTPPPIDDDDDFYDNFESFEKNKWESDDDFGDFADPPVISGFESNAFSNCNGNIHENSVSSCKKNAIIHSNQIINDSTSHSVMHSLNNDHNNSNITNIESNIKSIFATENQTENDSSSQVSKSFEFNKVPELLPQKTCSHSVSELDNSHANDISTFKHSSVKTDDEVIIEKPISQGDLKDDNTEQQKSESFVDANNQELSSEKNLQDFDKLDTDVGSLDMFPCSQLIDNGMNVHSLQGSSETEFKKSACTLSSQSVSNPIQAPLERSKSSKNVKCDSEDDSVTFHSIKTDFNSNEKNISEKIKSNADFGNFAHFENSSMKNDTLRENGDEALSGNEDFTAFADFNVSNLNNATNSSQNSTSPSNLVQNKKFINFSDSVSGQPITSHKEDEINFSSTHKEELSAAPFDAFANFNSSEVSSFPPNFESFANFESADTNQTSFGDDSNDFDDFGDFGTAESCFKSAPEKNLNCFTSEVSSYKKWFPFTTSNESNIEREVHPIDDYVEKNLFNIPMRSPSEISAASAASVRTLSRPSDTWNMLEDVDNAVALTFQWDSSSAQQCLLKALGIDTQHILFRGGESPYCVPTYYAAGLGLLQPDFDQSCSTFTSIVDNPPSVQKDDGRAADSETNGRRACSPGERAPPGVSQSPLTNSLNSNVLNFDLLDETFSKSNRQTKTSLSDRDKLDPELLELAMGGSPDVEEPKKSDPLARILASFKATGSRKSIDEEEHLSDDAMNVLRKLPDLSYMRSRVLMFPVSQPTAN